MKKTFFLLLCSILAGFAGIFESCRKGAVMEFTGSDVAMDSSSIVKIDTLHEAVMSIQQQSRLFTTECQIHKVVLYTDEGKIGGKLLDIDIPGDRKVAIPIDVTLKGYVDFTEFSEKNIRKTDSLCIVTLPDPEVVVTGSKIDHKATRQYVSMTRSRFSETEITKLTSQGEDTIINHITNYGIIEQSRESCARILVPLLTRVGFKESNIVIRFRKNYNDADLRSLTSFQK